jgi:hypothetical protein
VPSSGWLRCARCGHVGRRARGYLRGRLRGRSRCRRGRGRARRGGGGLRRGRARRRG